MANDDLEHRLAALKPPAVLPTSDDLRKRFEQTFNKQITLNNDSGENSDEDEDVKRLLEEASLLVNEAKAPVGDKSDLLYRSEPEIPDWLQDEEPRYETEEAVLKRIQDEIELERALGGGAEEDVEAPTTEEPGELGTLDADLEDLSNRLKALNPLSLPSVPRIEPGAPKIQVSTRTREEEEADTWCCICNEDGEYKCSGCENDIYCAQCLYEAHTGPDAGYEERHHKWTKYTKPRKMQTF